MAGQRAGKSQMIGILTGQYVTWFPKLKGFVGANTYQQLSQSTLVKVFEIWRDLYHLTEYDSKKNPEGHFVIDKRPPSHFVTNETFKDYNNICSFWNGHIIFLGSLENYKVHDGKEFAYAHLDETKDTREEAITSVILARLSQQGLFVYRGTETGRKWIKTHVKQAKDAIQVLKPNDLVYIPDYKDRQDDIKRFELQAFNPAWIHTSPAIGAVDWLVKMFDLEAHEPEIRKRITGTLPNGEPDFYHNEENGKCVVIFSTYHNKQNLPDNYIENRKAVLVENEQLKLVYGYPFSKTGGEYYSYFERLKHVRKVPYIPGITSHISWDFNVLPYMTMVCAQVITVDRYVDEAGVKHPEYKTGRKFMPVMQLLFYKEYCLATPKNTVKDECVAYDEDHKRQPNKGIFYYGDASGKNRIPGLGSLTNYRQVEMYLPQYLHNASDRVRKSNISPLIRRDFMNRLFAGKYPNIELYFDESMTETIRDFEYVKLGHDGKLKERVKDPQSGATYEKNGHTSDAVEYMICEMLKQYMKED